MKTTTIGRIGAIVTGAAMLGTAVASAMAGAVTVDANLDKGFFYDANMNPKVQVVVGEKAAASDGAAAGQIAAMIGNMAFSTETVSADGGEKTASGGTATCTPDAAQCGAGSASASGTVTLSWEAIGKIGEMQQKEMDCDIYGSGQELTGLTDGGDDGTWCDTTEIYTHEDTIGTTLVGSCATSAGADVSILKQDEFANNICTICYNFCDLALGCEPHMMSEWIDIDCSKVNLEYDCDDEELKLEIADEALVYNIFTDDILTEDIEADGDLAGQSYLGNIILGQNEYMVEDISEDSMTIVCGTTGTTTTSEALEYIPPAPGSACDAENSGEAYSIKLVGAQEIEEKGVVDVTLEVTKPDGTTEQVNSGISGTPVVGDLKVKLQRGTASSNIITGESSFTADLIVWYVPSEYTFEDGESYDEMGVDVEDLDDPRAAWALEFNGADGDISITNMSLLEEDEILANETATDLDDIDVDENTHYEDCYDEATTELDALVIRYLEFTLEDVEDDLPEGDLLNLPFNDAADGGYLLSDLKFGYVGLHDEDFLPLASQDMTTIEVEVIDVPVYIGSEDYEDYRTGVVVTYTDEWDEEQEVRVDEGPFEKGDVLMIGATLVKITDVDFDRADNEWTVQYETKDNSDDFDDETDVVLSLGSTAITVDSQIADFALPVDPEYTGSDTLLGDVVIDNTTDEDSEYQLYIGQLSTDNYANLTNGAGATTEFKNDVDWSAGEDTTNSTRDIITISGATDSGGEDEVIIWIDDDEGAASKNMSQANGTEALVQIADGSSACDSVTGQCEDIATGEDDGTLISLSGATVIVEGDEDVEEPADSGDEEPETIDKVTVILPEKEVRPTLFFGLEESQNSSSITITDANVGTEVEIGGLDVMVEEFGVTGSVSAGEVIGGEAVTVECSPVTVTCDAVSVDSAVANEIGYKLVVVEGAQSKENLVLIGGPSVNSLTKDLTTVDELCSAAVVKLVGNKLLVAGCEAADTAAAASDLVAWLKAL